MVYAEVLKASIARYKGSTPLVNTNAVLAKLVKASAWRADYPGSIPGVSTNARIVT